MLHYQKPETDQHLFVVYKETEMGYISDKNEDGDIILYTYLEAKREAEEATLIEGIEYKVAKKSEYQEFYKVAHSVLDGNTKTFGMTPKQR